MSIRRFFGVSVTAVVCGLLLAITTRPAHAEPPEGVVRTFAFVTSATNPVLPDFLLEDSLLVVAPPEKSSVDSAVEFIPDADADWRVDGTTWVYSDAIKVTPSLGATPGRFLWLLTEDTPEPPPTGSHAFTGSETVLDVFYRRLCESGDCGFDEANDGKYTVTDAELADEVFIVVTAVFSR